MPETETHNEENGAENGEHRLAMVSADRSEDEMREAYEVEWREPANKQSLADRVRDLL